MLNVFSLQLVLIGSVCFGWMYLSLVLHELAHVVVGRWVGFEPQEVVVGQGPPLFLVTLGGLPARFYLVPWGGLTVTRPSGDAAAGRRRALFPAAGVGVDFLFLLVVAGLAVRFHPASFALSPYGGPGKVAAARWEGFLGWILVLQGIRFLGNLVPRDIRGANSLRIPNDGKQILLYLFGKDVTYRFQPGPQVSQGWDGNEP